MVSPRLLREAARYSPPSAPSFNRHPIVNQFLGSLMGARYAGYYFLLYTYLKWVDDRVDAPDASPEGTRLFLESQWELLKGRRTAALPQERLGEEAGRFMLTDAGRPLYYSLRKLFTSFHNDVHRRNRILPYRELIGRVNTIGRSTLDICLYLFSAAGDRGNLSAEFKRDAAMVSVYLDMLLDMPGDLEVGYINIPHEVFETYAISPGSALEGDFAGLRRNPGIRRWIRGSGERLDSCFERLNSEVETIRDRPLRCFLTRILRSRARKLAALRARWDL